MLTRVLAYCLEYEEGIALTEGVAAGDEPAVIVRDLTGRLTAGSRSGRRMPAACIAAASSPARGRLHESRHPPGAGAARRRTVHRAGDVPVYTFDGGFIDQLAQHIDRRTSLSLSITEPEIFANVGPYTLTTTIEAHRIV